MMPLLWEGCLAKDKTKGLKKRNLARRGGAKRK